VAISTQKLLIPNH